MTEEKAADAGGAPTAGPASEAPEAEAPAASADALPCPAGESCGGRWKTEEPVYQGVDYLWMLLGVSSRPVPFDVKCARCGHVWSRTAAKRPY